MDGIDEPPSLPAEPAVGEIHEEEEGVVLEREEHEGEVEFEPNVDRYIHHLHQGYYDERLLNFHSQVKDTPQDHPLRAILESAADGSTIRVTAYSLTDMFIDLLSHHGGTKTVRVLLHRSSHKTLVKWVTEIGNKRALLENVEIRLITMTTVNNKASLPANSVITDTHTALGSYNLSNRPGNLDVLTVTPQESKDLFDWMWEQEMTNQVERIYKELYYVAPEGSKRKARYDAVNVQVAERKRAKTRAS